MKIWPSLTGVHKEQRLASICGGGCLLRLEQIKLGFDDVGAEKLSFVPIRNDVSVAAMAAIWCVAEKLPKKKDVLDSPI